MPNIIEVVFLTLTNKCKKLLSGFHRINDTFVYNASIEKVKKLNVLKTQFDV